MTMIVKCKKCFFHHRERDTCTIPIGLLTLKHCEIGQDLFIQKNNKTITDVKDANIKRCPNCNAVFEKEEFKVYIRCPRCHYIFSLTELKEVES